MDLVSVISILERIFSSYGFPIVFLSSFIEMSPIGWLLPGGLIVAIAGFFAYGDSISLLSILLLGWMGSWTTFLLAYILGNKTGGLLIRKLNQEKNAERARRLLKNHGGVILTTSMLAGLTRFWVAYVAGIQKYNLLRFIFYSGGASLTWTSLQVAVGYIAGAERSVLERGLQGLGIISWLFLGVAIYAVYKANKKDYEEFAEPEKFKL